MKTVYLCCEVIGGDRCGLVGRFHTYCTCRHCEGGSCAVCVCKGNAAAYNFPLIKYLAGRSRICSQGNGCTHCCLGDRSACTNGCSTACHGYIVLNSFPNCSYGSVSSNGNLVAGSLFNTANAPSLELLTGRSSEAICRERVFTGNTGYICHSTSSTIGCKGNGICYNRDVLPNCSYGSVSSNGNLVAGSLFNTANAPSLELLTERSSKAVCRERVFTGNIGYICHCACTAVSVKAYGVGRDRGGVVHRELLAQIPFTFQSYCHTVIAGFQISNVPGVIGGDIENVLIGGLRRSG